MAKKSRICILGATGFIGQHLYHRLCQLRYDVTSISHPDIDLSSPLALEKLAACPLFDVIFHLAAVHGAGVWPQKNREDIFEKNVAINHHVLSWWRHCQPQAKMICSISSCSYPASDQPLKETDYWKGELHGSVSTFGFSKKLLVAGLEAYQEKLKGTGVVFGTVYGPGADFFSDKSHVINALIGRFFKALRDKRDCIVIWGDGTQTREFVYVEDQVDSLIACIENETPTLLNATVGRGVSIRDLAMTIAEVVGYRGQIIFDANRYQGVQNKILDSSLAKKAIGWTVHKALIPLPEGVQRCFAYLSEKKHP